MSFTHSLFRLSLLIMVGMIYSDHIIGSRCLVMFLVSIPH